MTVHEYGAAGLDVDRVPEHRDEDQAERPPRDRAGCREPDERADERDRAGAAGEPDRDREELEDDQREPDDEQARRRSTGW